MKKKRSVGVTILGIYLLLCVIPAIIAFIIAGISSFNAKSLLSIILDIVIRSLFMASPLIFIASGIGLLMLKNWARLITIFLSPLLSFIAIGMLGIILVTIVPSSMINMVLLFGMVGMFVIIIYFLTRPKVKEQFK